MSLFKQIPRAYVLVSPLFSRWRALILTSLTCGLQEIPASTTAYDPGWAWVTVDLGNCQFHDSIYLVNGSLYTPITNDTAYCDSLTIDFDNPNLSSMY